MENITNWDENEIALLIETYLLIERGEYSRKDGCLILSNRLRNRAISHGHKINDTFRNFNVVLLMLSSIKYLFTDGRQGFSVASQSFKKMYIMYVNDREKFNKILDAAHLECDVDKSNTTIMTESVFQTENEKFKYINWLRFRGINENRIIEMVKALKECDDIARKTSVINKQDHIWNYQSGVTLDNIIYRLKKKYDFASINYDNKGFYSYVIDNFLEYKKNKAKVPYIGVSTEKVSFKKYFMDYLSDNYPENDNEDIKKYINIINNAGAAVLNKNFNCLKENDLSDVNVINRIIFRINVRTNANPEKAISVLNLVFKVYSEWNKNNRGPYNFKNVPTKINIPDKLPIRELSKESILEDVDRERFSEILQTEFEDGLLLDIIGLDTFREIYTDKFDKALTSDDELLKRQLQEIGVLIDNRIYFKKSLEQTNLLKDIISDIIKELRKGFSCVFLKSIMKKWKNQLSDQLNVYDEKVLKELIIKECNSELVFRENIITFIGSNSNIEDDVLSYMKKNYDFVSYDMLENDLWFIPLELIKGILTSHPMLALVDSEKYFYAPNFPASYLEIEQLKTEMKLEIERKGFLVAKDIKQIIENKCNVLAINTYGYRDIAYRNILKCLLKKEFEFNNSIISEKGNRLTMSDVFREFCLCHEHLSLEELKQFAAEISSTIYWEDVMATMVRLNQNSFIKREYINFDITGIDKVLEELCPGNYIPIQNIQLFLQFPDIGYPWNAHVLESYLSCSKKFKLYHTTYSENGVYGIIAKIDSGFVDYKSVVIDILAENHSWKTEKDAISFIVELGCQAKKRWAGFTEVVKEAKLIRDKKGERKTQ